MNHVAGYILVPLFVAAVTWSLACTQDPIVQEGPKVTNEAVLCGPHGMEDEHAHFRRRTNGLAWEACKDTLRAYGEIYHRRDLFCSPTKFCPK